MDLAEANRDTSREYNQNKLSEILQELIKIYF